ncbi:MAG: M20/M25/M40 family metallo-hydrolase, partial [Gemmataceae bacterium]
SLSSFLEKEGAAAIFQDAGKPLGLLVTTGSWGGSGDRSSATNRLPTLFVAHNHYDMLYRLANRPAPARTRVELEVNNTFVPGPVKVFNTVGEIIGSEKPNEYVVVGAHLDSWDLGQGTTDNGTGSSTVLEVARIITRLGVQPKRTIRFVLFTGEEQGLHGSRAFVQKHKEDLARTSAALIHDTGTGRVKGVGTGGFPIHTSILERELGILKELGVTDFNTPSVGGSDHQSFTRVGVPGLMMVQDMSTYTYTHHTEIDTLDAAIESNLLQGAQTMAITAMRIANLNSLLPRVSGGGNSGPRANPNRAKAGE